MKLTRAVHHIPLGAANAGKLAKLDALAEVYLPLVQQYVTHFCTETLPARFAQPCFESTLVSALAARGNSARGRAGAVLANQPC